MEDCILTKILSTLGWISIIGGIIFGFIIGLNVDWVKAFTCWVGGAISGVLFIAFSMMLEYLEENNYYLRELLNRTQGQQEPPRKPLGNSKASLKSLSGFKVNSHE